MSNKAKTAEPINPGQPPKKDNTLLIVIVCLILFIGLPVIIAIGAMIWAFSTAGVMINHAIDASGNLPSIIFNPEGEEISSRYSDALYNMYIRTSDEMLGATTGSSYLKNPVSRTDCFAVERFIKDEAGEDISICDTDGFTAYVSEGSAVSLELYGIGDDSGRMVNLELNRGADKYYRISFRNSDTGNIGAAVKVKYVDDGVKNDETPTVENTPTDEPKTDDSVNPEQSAQSI
jgi:hypothetical protein